MKLIVLVLLLLFSSITYAQFNVNEISKSVNELNDANSKVYEYDIVTNSLKCNLYFIDEESFKAYTQLRNINSIFDESFQDLSNAGTIDKMKKLGVSKVNLIIKTEDSGEIITNKIMAISGIKEESLIIKTVPSF
ncbi:MAG: hypothetical protein ABFR62_00735 [Bacteroidota bacterium]